MLHHFGMRAETSSSGAAGIALLKTAAASGDPFQLVLLDWLMPGMDGIQTARQMRDDAAVLGGVPAVLMITAGSYEKVIEKLSAVGLDHVLAKPVSESSLHDALLEVLLGAPLADAHRKNRDQKCERQYDFSGIRNARVLLVDDVELNRVVALAFLRQAGIKADIAVHGRDAVQKIVQNDYDLVLMDIQMPELDGLAATREIRSNSDPRFAKLPIVAMTAHAMSGDRERSLDAGMNDHLIKPIDPDALFAALLRWIPPHHAVGDDVALRAERTNEADATPIPALDGIDTARGLVNHLRRPALYRQILNGFNQEFGATADDIAEALSQGDFIGARRLAHSLKSAAATIGALELSHCAKQLEERYAEQAPADREFPPLVLALRRVVTTLAAWADSERSPRLASQAKEVAKNVAAPVDREVQRALIERLELLLKNDDAAAGRLLAEIKAGLPGPRHQDDLRLLRDLIDDIEYEAALGVLSRLRSTLTAPAP
jgi:CheY-like chemotaxis protein